MSFDESRTCPRLRDPSGRPTSTSSPYPTHSVFSTKMSGPAISVMVRYSVGISGGPQSFEFVVHLSECLRELLIEFRFVLDPRQEFAGLQRRDVLRRDVQFHGLLTEVGVFLDRGDQLELPFRRAKRVDGMIRILLEKDLADHSGDFERELLVRREGVRADEPDDFLQFRLLLQRALRPRSQLRPFLVHVLPEPVLQDLRVQAVRLKPVYRREVPPSPQGGVQGPEHLHDAEGALGDRLREVPATRGHGADDANGTLEATQRLGPTGALVELAEPRGQVRGEAFFARHLFETRCSVTVLWRRLGKLPPTKLWVFGTGRPNTPDPYGIVSASTITSLPMVPSSSGTARQFPRPSCAASTSTIPELHANSR